MEIMIIISITLNVLCIAAIVYLYFLFERFSKQVRQFALSFPNHNDSPFLRYSIIALAALLIIRKLTGNSAIE